MRFDLDLERWTFAGDATIALTLATAAREITLHSVDLDIKTGGDVTGVTYDEESQTATLTLARKLPAGRSDLRLAWSGTIAEKLRGLYRSTRPGERYAVTQFEAADARRAFPCFDEPEVKPTFASDPVHDPSRAVI